MRNAFSILLILAGQAAAQECKPGLPPNPAPVRRALVGIVLDTANNPVENARVVIEEPWRFVRSALSGRFELPDIEPGTYEVTVKRLGYRSMSAAYVVTDSGGVARFCLSPETRALATVVTAVSRLGLSGIVGDSTSSPIEGAQISAMARNRSTSSDADGRFNLPLNPGTYAILVKKPGFASQTLSVTIPRDSGREIAVRLGSPLPDKERQASNMEGMRNRLLRAKPMYSALVSGEQIARSQTDLAGVAQSMAKGSEVPGFCPAVIDGGPTVLSLDKIDKDDVATMEVYWRKMTPRELRQMSAPGARVCVAVVYVWMKPESGVFLP